MTYTADASSVILLSKIGLLQLVVERFGIVIPEKVYEEVSAGKSKGRIDALELERLVEERKIKVVEVPAGQKEKIKRMLGMFAGEMEVIAYAQNQNLDILTDDRKCFNAAKSLKLRFATTLDMVIEVHKKGFIEKKRAIECIDKLENYGWYKHSLVDAYRRRIK